ncbi:hypothetical protein ACEWAY_24485, partial [Vibrio parahaemolyticus]
EFDPAVELSGPLGQALSARIEQLVTTAERLGPRKSLSAVAAADWREQLLNVLLNDQRHSLSSAIDVFNGRTEAQPAALKRVRAYL